MMSAVTAQGQNLHPLGQGSGLRSDFKVSLGRSTELLITSTAANQSQNSCIGVTSYLNDPRCTALPFIQLTRADVRGEISTPE